MIPPPTEWGAWDPWSSCANPYAGPECKTSSRSRLCDGGIPGLDCKGNDTETDSCPCCERSTRISYVSDNLYDLVENKETTQNVMLKWPAMDAYRVEVASNVVSPERCCYKCGKKGATTTTEGDWLGKSQKCRCTDIREF